MEKFPGLIVAYLFKFQSFDIKMMYAGCPKIRNTEMFKEHIHSLTLGFFKSVSPGVPTISILFLLFKNIHVHVFLFTKMGSYYAYFSITFFLP